jgi:threonylcarbamoyladenosine tRNA methylthiotransferase MtaB
LIENPSGSFSYQIQTFGCKVNSYDSGLLQKRLSQSGWSWSATPKVHVLNTCAVTAEATKEAVRRVRKIKIQDPFSLVVVTGCAAQVDTDKFSSLPGVDLVVANSHKGDLENIVRDYYKGSRTQKVFKSNIFKKEDLEAGGGEERTHTRSFLKIQDGCNSFCTFCVIPFARGKSRSIEISNLVSRIRELEEQSVKEIVLTGVHIGDYEDQGKKLEDLIEAVLLQTKIPRIRLTSLEPIEVSDRLLELFSNPRLCRHFHMSIQSAQTKVLQAMKRQYGAKEVEDSLIKIAQSFPDAFVGMDVIAGFPGETDEEFQETFDRLEALPWSRIHVFPYSPRPGTYASRLDEIQLPREVIMNRAKQLRELSLERYTQKALEQIGQVKSVLLLGEGGVDGTRRSLSRDYWPVLVENAPPPGLEADEIRVKIRGFDHSNASKIEAGLVGQYEL